ncbi:Ig-like domain-containing protein [Acerihabitans arboris]|uniref:Big-1 domain-containing protein n=1 Tax=Acerihabitans arboris TaxID=2691583 RepID=A0A845SM30_9GAMM|nr:Ig-like domain-containing protein [Acerihabitans arboris]NDL63681.1 hypothetical protein [Acerihabitans arboris]
MQDQFFPSDNHDKGYSLILASSPSAQADGRDANYAVATLSAQGAPLCGYNVTFCLSGCAVFSDGNGQCSAATDDCGQATVYFTDSRQETVTVSVQFENLSALSYSTFSNSINATGLIIIAQVQRDNAQGNTIDQNAILYTLWDEAINQAVPFRRLLFNSSSSTAVFDLDRTTDPNGQILLLISNYRDEQVEISAVLDGQSAVNNYTVITFSVALTHTISAQMLTGNVTAPGTHQIRYTLRTAAGATVPGQLMAFSSSTASISPGYQVTDNAGQVTVNIRSETPQTARVDAIFALGNAENHMYVTFN